ncbi:MAG: voltage-gated potassium channel protein [Acidiferrobacteraceae bacterium]
MSRIRSRLSLDAWFPHMPLALATALFGLLSAWPLIRHISLSLPNTQLRAGTVLALPGVRPSNVGIPQIVAGVVLVAMAVGLLLRSRLAWTVSLILVGAILVMAARHDVQHGNPEIVLSSMILLALLVFHRSFSRSSLATATLFTVVSIVLLFGYAGFGAYVLGAGFSPAITNLPEAFYFAVVTMSTVGYGDIVPRTGDARLFVSSIIILGITVFATSLSAVLMPMINRRIQQLLAGEKKHMVRTKHYIVAGDTSLAHSTYQELKARHLPVTVILARAADTVWVESDDLVLGDPTDIETLKNAGAQDAIAVLALREDDRENAFIVLALKELGTQAHTVAAVRDSRNLVRVRRVGPDMIIAPDVIGGELLAMALTGEELNGDALLRKIFHAEADSGS